MTTNGYLEDDELILYAMHALSDMETLSVSKRLGQDEGLRQRLADIRLTLGLYAEAVIEPVEVPVGSLDRLMSVVAQERSIFQMPQRGIRESDASKRSVLISALRWGGWAVAAALLVTAEMEYRESRRLSQKIAEQGSQIQQATLTATAISQQRDALQQALRENVQLADATIAEISTYKDQSATLAARVAAESTRAQRENSRANDLASIAATSGQENARLRGTLEKQNGQVAQLNAQSENARQVLDALADPTALRVTLTVPKQKKTPSGRGTYVPSRGTLIFTASNLRPLAGRVYELWVMPSDGSTPIPVETFLPDAAGNATIISTHFQRSIKARGFAVTAEPTGGSQKPTLPILLAGL